jgi:hypothetical protein
VLDERQQQRTELELDQLDLIADALECLPRRVASALRAEGIGLPKRRHMRQLFFQVDKEHREAKEAKRRANIAIGLTGLTALASPIAAAGTLLQG